jgi:CubicO group peptidase (beta-lactamase class C family)
MRLTDGPQDRIDEWPITKDDPLSGITLAQLLGFTSGLEKEPLVLNAKRVPFEASALAVARENAGTGASPGKRFFYSGTHLQVAGLMAVRSGGFADWQAAFDEFRGETGLFASSAYDLPSALNPRIAGGMHWTAEDYIAFLRKLSRGELLGKAMMEELLRDRTPRKAVSVGYSPVLEAMGEDWHYGSGLWIEELGPDGRTAVRVSCPGAYGAYPFWDRAKGYFGIVARQGPLGSFPEGIAIERSVRSLVEEWVAAE